MHGPGREGGRSRDVIYRHRNLVDLDLGVDDAWTRQGGREDAVSRDVIYGHRNLVDLDLGVDDAWTRQGGREDAVSRDVIYRRRHLGLSTLEWMTQGRGGGCGVHTKITLFIKK